MRKTILILLLILCGNIRAEDQERKLNGKIYAIIVGDTFAYGIGPSVKVDIRCMEKSIATIAHGINFNVQNIFLTGRKYSHNEVFRALKKIKPSPKDIIIFYYSGHGYNDVSQNTAWPVMNCSTEDIAGNQVRTLIHSKTKRSAIIIFDCCNYSEGLEKSVFSTRAQIKPFYLKKYYNLKEFLNLLLGLKGTVTLCASAVGETAVGDPHFGGYLTRNFLQTIRTLGSDETVSWDRICSICATNTTKLANDLWSHNQHPIFSLEED